MSHPPNPYEELWPLREQTRPADGKGRWVYSTGTFKDAFTYAGDSGTPFVLGSKIAGWHEWQNTVEGAGSIPSSKARLKLKDAIYDPSGATYFKLQDGWQGLFYIKTLNNDFFEDEAIDSVSSNWDDFQGSLEMLEGNWPTVWVQDDAEYSDSRAIFALEGGDYASFDVDHDHADIAQMRVRIHGDDYFSNTATRDAIWVTCLWLRKWDATYDWPPEIVDPVVNCNAGFHLVGGVCVAYAPECPDGSFWNGYTCAILDDEASCATGYSWDNDLQVCVSDNIPDCEEGYHLHNGVCVIDTPTCPEGSTLIDGVCVVDSTTCPEGSTMIDGVCVIDTTSCPVGQHLNQFGVCVPNEASTECETGFHLEDGVCVADIDPEPEDEEIEVSGFAMMLILLGIAGVFYVSYKMMKKGE